MRAQAIKSRPRRASNSRIARDDRRPARAAAGRHPARSGSSRTTGLAAPTSPPAPAPTGGGAPAPPSGGAAAPNTSVTGRAGEVARATLNAIDFPSFVASLIQGTFKAIVDASIQQMQAYAELLKNVAGTVDTFMADNVTEGNAKDYLADEHPASSRRTHPAAHPC